MLKLFQEWGERGIKENSGGGEFKYLIYCKNFYKCHNVSQPSTATKRKLQKIIYHILFI
jgi:hypothetical protein